jgi:hypothetical protein
VAADEVIGEVEVLELGAGHEEVEGALEAVVGEVQFGEEGQSWEILEVAEVAAGEHHQFEFGILFE